ncbi:mitochondrial import inner membrane translocase subunit tim54 [Elasticomyces elasticus]|uniref:Mitochondrial import inner membrane translocase subunit TIM54 n=1 Tax=Exophiala sideris TaxID=1016849 RepID=A0ABR0JJI9_9EURO|nr:mitochondrial import inner membrane translocase subunit tim54 [Elasticomyces elasticus]KAK5035236.1 mitochondrial import inner membrane translocase subunit tim54 [Exophiala sideris]KAK5039412.1 mitochondrial import inner membrane translocase subunit tim54 [Exophiala sideris]KAK5066160.1 mitochondrial import inner membrane translocase subunit tim54 [Exophiala sideris]KAK5186837.1 mitochondrial import inner membrane translocase subunit tim54 [Eurotiomycetes sp. CCFEE 6388]
MAESPKTDSIPEGAKYEAPKPPPKQNPVFRMMGLPNWRLRLPSRNWMIFLTITGSWTAAVIYDKQQKKKVQQKWCDLVAHIAQEPLPVNQMRRRLTIFLSAPPGDGISASRRYFKEYVKPVLVAAAMDYDVVEGRKEGDVRYGTAEQIRRLRRKRGEKGPLPAEEDEEPDTETAIDMIREKMQVVPEPGVRGDLVLGRHTWKEYVRGVHEGWLGPVQEPLPPPPPPPELEAEPSPIHPPTEARTDDPAATTESLEPQTKAEEEKKEEEKEKKKPSPPPAYLSIDKYSSASLSPNTPSTLEPSQPIYQQHLIGFLKTPQRIYNFLNRRHLADQIGRDTASIVLASYRPYAQGSALSSSGDDLDAVPVATKDPESDALPSSGRAWEQQTALAFEEPWWHKSAYKSRKEGDETERILANDMVIDTRIGERMRKFELDPEEQARANRIASGAEATRAVPVEDLRKEKVVLGNIDEV